MLHDAAVVGGGLTGCEIAYELALQGKGTLAVDNGREQGFLTSFDSKFAQHYRQVALHRQHHIQRQLRECCQRAFQLDAARSLRKGRTP